VQGRPARSSVLIDWTILANHHKINSRTSRLDPAAIGRAG
jgi:hypothetical protein